MLLLVVIHSPQGIWNREQVAQEVEAMIEDLQLVDKANVPSGHLSGGQKRKLRSVLELGCTL